MICDTVMPRWQASRGGGSAREGSAEKMRELSQVVATNRRHTPADPKQNIAKKRADDDESGGMTSFVISEDSNPRPKPPKF